MSNEARFTVVFVRFARVEDVIVVDELHVPRLHVHKDVVTAVLGHLVYALHRALGNFADPRRVRVSL